MNRRVEIHTAGARPRSSGEVSGKDIEKRIFLDGFQPAISRRVGIAGVEGPNQLGVFLDDDPQSKVRGGRRRAPFKLPPATGQWSGQQGGQNALRGRGSTGPANFAAYMARQVFPF